MTMYPLTVLLPLFVGGIAALAMGVSPKSERYAKYIALAGALGSALLTVLLLVHAAPLPSQIAWFSAGGYSFHLELSFTSANQLLLLLIAVISPLIFLYSVGYMDVPSEQSRYYFLMSLFAVSMTLLAMSGGFLTFFIAWEGLGITSYLLIGFWYHKEAPPLAARKAITTILVGDICLLAGMLMIWSIFHTFSFAAIISGAHALATIPTIIIAAGVLLLVGAFTKSAQFPFHEWLSDAMEGPTPVSAFLHSSTMVKAGVFLAILLIPLFIELKLLWLMLVIGAITVLVGAVTALASDHIKKILAYSTMEDLGLMFVALGLNAIPAALLFFAVQAIYKALLLMSSGTIMKANGDDVNIYRVSSFGRNRLLFISALIGALSLAGLFPFSGFFGKVAIDSAAVSNVTVYVVLTVADFLTALYIFRWLFVPMGNQRRAPRSLIIAKFATMKRSMQAPQAILAAGVLAFTAYLFINGNFAVNLTAASIETAVVVFGMLAAYIMFRKTTSMLSERSRARLLMHTSYPVNAAYNLLAASVIGIARGAEAFERYLNRVLYAGARGVVGLGSSTKVAENGNVNIYVAALAAGLVIVLLLLILVP